MSTDDTGSDFADQAIVVILGTNMLVGGIIAFVLDNTLSGMFWLLVLCIERNYCDRIIIREIFLQRLQGWKFPLDRVSPMGLAINYSKL